ncbi:hypothetical protein N6H14_21620 [Paenibacillus sp. CC-CFT747]|nr:hypothetical protein N6H14_21620 [Paenibacillus sp. CC-CFT747]
MDPILADYPSAAEADRSLCRYYKHDRGISDVCSRSAADGRGPSYGTTTVMYLLYQTAFQFGKLGLACAMGVILASMIFIISIIQFRFLKTDVEY